MARPFIISTCLSPLSGKSLTSLIEVFISKWTLKWRLRIRVVCMFLSEEEFPMHSCKNMRSDCPSLTRNFLQRHIYQHFRALAKKLAQDHICVAPPFIISTCLSPLSRKSLTSLIEVFISKWTLKWRFRMRVVCMFLSEEEFPTQSC